MDPCLPVGRSCGGCQNACGAGLVMQKYAASQHSYAFFGSATRDPMPVVGSTRGEACVSTHMRYYGCSHAAAREARPVSVCGCARTRLHLQCEHRLSGRSTHWCSGCCIASAADARAPFGGTHAHRLRTTGTPSTCGRDDACGANGVGGADVGVEPTNPGHRVRGRGAQHAPRTCEHDPRPQNAQHQRALRSWPPLRRSVPHRFFPLRVTVAAVSILGPAQPQDKATIGLRAAGALPCGTQHTLANALRYGGYCVCCGCVSTASTHAARCRSG